MSSTATQKVDQFLNQVAKRQDIVLALIFVLAIFMMIFPLPLFMIDFMIAVNLATATLLLLIATYMASPAEFSSFPTLLLLTTLYRLALTLSTSKMILLKHEAGDIITAFGNFVVGGNIAVGIIVFAILTIIQFLVITKGSERVAEVSARFSLDAMPGKQMSIDGDMRAGTLDADEAKRQRLLVQQESQLYGAMDGAMKFIKGDAIASIIVILVNIVGGIAIGVLQQGLSATEAAKTYTILSIGDGLVSQIPALMISITSGIIVTRVPSADGRHLAEDLFQQLGQHVQPLFMAAGLLAAFAFVPGFPAWAFLSLAGLIGGLAYQLNAREKVVVGVNRKTSSGISKPNGLNFQPGAVPLSARFPSHWRADAIASALERVHQFSLERLGLALPEVATVPPKKEEPERLLALELYQDRVCSFEIDPHKSLCVYIQDTAPSGSEPAVFPYAGPNACWVPEGFQAQEGLELYEGESILVYLFERNLLHLSKEFLGIQETRYLMEAMETRYAELVKEVQRQVPLSRLTDVLQRLLEEGVSIKNLRAIFEALIAWSGKEKDIVLLTEYVRIALKRQIIGQLQDLRKGLQVWNMGEALENMIRASIRQTTAGSYAALDVETSQAILELIKQKIGISKRGILLTVVDVRRYLRKLIENELFDVSVISRQELSEETPMNLLGNIEWIEGEETGDAEAAVA